MRNRKLLEENAKEGQEAEDQDPEVVFWTHSQMAKEAGVRVREEGTFANVGGSCKSSNFPGMGKGMWWQLKVVWTSSPGQEFTEV